MSMGQPQLWRGEFWQVPQLLDNLYILMPHGYTEIHFVNHTGALRITTVDDRATVQKGDFIWIRNGRMETGDIDDVTEARAKDKMQHG